MSFINAKIVAKQANPDKYHAQSAERGAPGFIISSSVLREFARCPSRWKAGYEPPGSDSLSYGSLLDCLVLTPDQFDDRFVVRPATYPDSKTGDQKPWNGNSTWCKEWLQNHENIDVVSGEGMKEAEAARDRLLADELIRSFHDCSDRQVWVSADWQDKDTGLVLPCKALLDYVPRLDSEFAKSLGDLKSSRSGALTPFQRQVYQYGWYFQAALYLDMYVAATAEDRVTYCLIGQENYHPWEPFRRMLAEDYIAMGRGSYEMALKCYARCVKTGKWPGYDDHADSIQGWSLCSPEPWMQFESLQKTMETSQAEFAEVKDENPDLTP